MISPRKSLKRLLCAGLLVAATPAAAQFNSGSDGSDGVLNVTSNQTLALPPDGIFNFTTINIASGQVLTFTRNELNTPVYLLATGDVVIDGEIRADGGEGSAVAGGLGGPGGFNGGAPGLAGDDPGVGLGPGGGGIPGGNGAYSTGPTAIVNPATDGEPYGSRLLVPMIGGSGGGGLPNVGGDGGGGAILIASNSRVDINGRIAARPPRCSPDRMGSGGAVRVVAPIIGGAGQSEVLVWGCFDAAVNRGGAGRVRFDVIDRSQLGGINVGPSSALAVGAFMAVFPDPLPRLDIIEAAGTLIPEGSGSAVDILLPLNAPSMQDVVVQARDFSGQVPISVVLTPASGDRVVYDAIIDMSGGNPSTATVTVEVPPNVPVEVNVWTHNP